jgi:hypothetical protein
MRKDAARPAHESEDGVTEPDAVDLIHLEDPDGDYCIVRVTGRQPCLPTSHGSCRSCCDRRP